MPPSKRRRKPGDRDVTFSFDWANPTAQCYVCARCGYIHWFMPVNP